MLLEIKHMLEQITNETLQERVYKAIKESIMNNDLLPGQLLSIDELAKNLGVSPTPIREALTRLTGDGLVERSPNKTACVVEIKEDDVHQNYTIRKLIEPYATAVTARRTATMSGIRDRITKLQKEAEFVQDAVEAGRITDSVYHTYCKIGLILNEIILDSQDHELMKRVFSLIMDHSLRIRFYTETSSCAFEERSIAVTNKEHMAIIDAILRGDEKKTEQAVREHLSNAEMRTVMVARNSLHTP
jgi:DNA-binding GntR family transcriptional regulator